MVDGARLSIDSWMVDDDVLAGSWECGNCVGAPTGSSEGQKSDGAARLHPVIVPPPRFLAGPTSPGGKRGATA